MIVLGTLSRLSVRSALSAPILDGLSDSGVAPIADPLILAPSSPMRKLFKTGALNPDDNLITIPPMPPVSGEEQD